MFCFLIIFIYNQYILGCMEDVINAEIIERLSTIQNDLDFIKGHLKDADVVMTEDDYNSITEAEADLKAGMTTRL